ncbi:MAG: hypothetical protein QOD32_1176 [Pyrinomonadaceae bacterium]|jgi:CHAT domain-containing protein/tetratricopeptide (TPR) repeat protein|nr:hypothetical protein [Pyrinomonadaceae bacterium]
MPRLNIKLTTALILALYLVPACCFAQQPTISPPPAASTPAAAVSSSSSQTPPANVQSKAIEDFASALISASTEEERQTLLRDKKELVTIELRQVVHARGDREREAGHAAQSFLIYQLARQIAGRIKDMAGEAHALEEIALAYYERDEYDAAMSAFEETLRLESQLRNVRKVAGTLNQIGMVHRARGEYPQAIESYAKAQAVNEPLGDQKVLIQTLINLGIVYRQKGDYEAALNSYQQALKVQEALGDKGSLARLFNSIGNVYWSQGNYAQAIEHFQKGLKLAEEIKQTRTVSTLLNNLGESYALAGDPETALSYMRRSMDISAANQDKRQLASVLDAMGSVERRRGATARALESYQKSLQLREELKDKAGISEALGRIALVRHMQGEEAEALRSAERAAAIAKEIGKREVFWRARAVAGEAHRALDQTTEARLAFDEAIAAIEDLRRQVAGGEESQQRYFEDKVSPYYDMIELLVQVGKPHDALVYAERAKARVLLDVLGRGRRDVNKHMTAPERERELKLRSELFALNAQVQREGARSEVDPARLSALQARLEAVRLDYDGFQTSLYAAHPELKVQRGEAQPLTTEQLSALLPDTDTAFVEFAVTKEQTFVFVLTARAVKSSARQINASTRVSPQVMRPPDVDLNVYRLPVTAAALAERVERFRTQLARRDILFGVEARTLYDLLLKPAEGQLRGKKTLVIVPDGELWELPFQALQPAPARYLVEDQAISYAPSLSVLREMTRRGRSLTATAAKSLLAIGNPALVEATVAPARVALLGDAVAPSLPEAELQVKALGQLYGASRSKIYVGAEAREERVKTEAGNYQVIHLATHGVLNDASPMYSYVMLAREPRMRAGGETIEDGLLEAWELMNMDLKAEMVVLSACETARGRVSSGEGMIGLAWALFVAGSPVTVVSQWKVESAGTTELMLVFHRNLQAQPPRGREATTPHMSKAEALRRAALSLLRSEKYSHPFYWAGFVMIGDGGIKSGMK